ncbi:filamentous haemagglutinin family protein [Methylovulum sp.]|uniref:filamentous haemagglutinin family protein n=1 Tax=Methylovulum sp. TaxID=1916980 RepID=UPI00345716A4
MGSVTPVQAELPIPASSWAAKDIATQQIIDNGSTLHIDQHVQNAVLNWDKFNVGAKNKVEFNQPNSSSIALNRIFQGAPSEILGKITANGQIYLYNQNGFVFGKDSVVNVNTLVASTLDISDEVLNNGLVQQAGKAIDRASLGANNDGDRPTMAKSFVRVEQGAKIQANGDANNDGLVILAAPTVENKGSISTNEFGQVILVGSKDKVYLQAADNQSPFSGLLVEVETGGNVSNVGDILVRQGNITLEGFAVNQEGRLTATTSVNVNGSIRLLAQEKHSIESGNFLATKTIRDTGSDRSSSVTFGAKSVTEIVGDTETKDTAIDSKSQTQSYIEVVANKIHMKSGAQITAPNADINMVATDDLTVIDRTRIENGKRLFNVVLKNKDATRQTQGRIFIEEGAVIDVSGNKNVKVAMERNVGEVSVQTFDLRDSPFQKGGVLQGQTVRIDTRKDTKIVDATGAVNSIQRTIDERLTKGGNINLSANGDVVINSGAVVNISGGSIDYQDGYINTTKLLTDYGKIVDISEADPNEKYVSILGVYKEVHEKWGITKIWDNSALFGMRQFEKGYTQGQDAGKINIQAPLLSWNANLIAGSSAGAYQRDLANQPFGGSFIVNQDRTLEKDLISLQDVIIQSEENNFALKNISAPFPTKPDETTPTPLILSSSLFNGSGIQNVLVRTGGNIKINKTVTLDKLGADISLDGGSVDVYGKIYSAGGEINLNTNTYGVDRGQSGEITLGRAAMLDVSGRWINDYQLGFAAIPVDPLLIDGGSVNLTAVRDLKINAGASIKADGGAHLSINNTLTEGKGGDISLAAVGYLGAPSVLHLNGKLSAWGLSEGGSLNLTSAKIAVGSFATTPDSNGIAPLVLSVTNGNFDKLANSGFSKINLESKFDNLKVSGDTHLTLLAKNRVLDGDFSQHASGKQLLKFSHVETLPEHLRNPVDLNLTAQDDVVLATGSEIIADTGASIDLVSHNAGIFVDGKISAPAGSINLSIDVNDASSPLYNPAQAIWLGSHSQLLAAGATIRQPLDASNRRLGDVLDGGKVSLTANRGYVVQEEGSLIDVSGTQAVLDLPVIDGNSTVNSYQPKNIGSNAGSIAIASGEGVVLEGSIKGQAGSKTTNNGRFDLTLNPDIRGVTDDNTSFPNGPTVIKVTQHKENVLSGKASYGDSLDDLGLNGVATVSSDFIENGNFGDVRLTDPDEIRFVGSVDLNTKARIELNTQKIGWEAASGSKENTVKLDTAYFKAGLDVNVTNTSFNAALKKGEGKLTTNSLWTELVGPTRWDSFKQINFKSTHELRVRGVYDTTQQKYLGSLKTAANLNLNASQIYPSTLTEFTFTVDQKASPNGRINITGRNTDETPLSADGVLNFVAPNINQNGVLKAPFGAINLNAGTRLTLGGKSLTSVSADGKLIPFGNTLGGLFWIYPKFDERRLVFNAKSQDYRPIQSKQVNLTAPDIELAKGSKIDVSGGGDLLSYEFIPNSGGGTNDYLDSISPSYQGGFAIVPSFGSSLAPYDPLQQQDFAKLTAEQQAIYGEGNKVYLSGSGQLPAGNYTILPARYALLPGAFLVTPQANTQDQVLTTYNAADQTIVSGHFANAGAKTHDARSSGFLLESGDEVRKHSQYIEETANSFFVKQAILKETTVPLIPKDSGQIAIDVANKLIVEGSINSTPMTDVNGVGRGGKLDITTNNNIKIVDALSVTDKPGTLEILANGLNNLNLDSLFLGGVRSRDNATGQTNLLVKTANVEVDNGVNIKVKDLIVAAKNKVSIDSDAVLTASGEVNTGDTVLKVTNYGALLRVSGDKQISLSDESTRNSSQGELTIGAGAVINGITKGNVSTLKSVLLDGSKNTRLAGDILMTGGSLSLYANAINLGELSNDMPGALNLSNQKLSHLSVDELQLNSRQAINLYGSVGQVGGDGQFLTEGGEVVPLHFGSLLIDAAGFSGFDNQGKSVRLQADSLILQNSTGAASVAGTGNGRLDFLTNNYTQGAGRFAFNGFNTVNVKPLSSSEQASHFHIDGESVVTVAGDLNIKTDYLAGTGGADLVINAAGHKVNFTNAGHVDNTVASGFGAGVSILADDIDFNTTALLYSGKLALHATQGGVVVGEQAKIDLSGKEVKFADVKQYTPGGVFSAEADQGKITLSANSNVNLNSGGGGAEGGRLILKAPKQTIDWSGMVTATSGSAVVDIKNFSPSMGFVDWMGILAKAGISESLYFRTRESDIVQGGDNTIKAKAVSLVADQGAINLSGTINTDGGAEGGAIELYAGDKITLQNGSVLTSKGVKGGKVLLSSVDADKDGISGIALQSGASIDVTGSAVRGGEVVLRALRDSTGKVINISPIAENVVKGAANYYAEGVQKYGNADIANGEINSTVIATIKSDTDAYMTAANMQQVNDQIDSKIQLRAGVEIDYTGNLTVKDKWDFQEWRYGDDIAGNLVMSATGKLTIANSISDAYKRGFDAFFNQVDILQGGNSWSYQLTAGADLHSADNFATINNSGHNLEIQGAKNAPVTVRTGVGDIKLAAGGDIIFKNQYATVYSAGKPTETQRYGVLGDYLTTTDYASLVDAEYAVDGGDLVFKADNNIQGAVSDQFISEWLVRVGDWGSSRPLNDATDSRIATAWGVNVNTFRQNVGLFGGGKVDINAGGNINNLSVMMPTTGKQIGTLAGGNNSSGAPKFSHNVVDVKGGGQLLVKAGGDIAGGAYFLGKGDGNISADGQVTGGKEFINGPQLVMGDATLALSAKQGVSLTAVSDAMMLSNLNQFYSYTQTSGITVKSLSGDVILGADTSVVRNKLGLLGSEDEAETIIYPSSVETTAFGGSVYVDQINLFPSISSKLNILAKESIKANTASESTLAKGFFLRDVDISLLPNYLSPVDSGFDHFVGPLTETRRFFTSSLPLLHRDDKEPVRLITQDGDIQDIQAIFAKHAVVQAGRDLSNLSLDIQNIQGDDVTILSAGRDINYDVPLDDDFGFLIVNNATAPFLQISGPGDVLVKTGRNLDLGVSKGLLTVGGELNSNLDSKGANVSVLAGLNGYGLNYTGFISKYLEDYPLDNNFDAVSGLITTFIHERLGDDNITTPEALKLFKNLDLTEYAGIQGKLNALILPVYQNNGQLSYQGISNQEIIDSLKGNGKVSYDTLIDKYLQHFAVAEQFNSAYGVITGFMRDRLGSKDLTDAQALALFKVLESDDYLSIQQQLNNAVLPVYFNEIKESGAASANDKASGNDRAYAAINTLFPGSELKTDDQKFPWAGNVNLTFSTIQTVEGGDINLLVPGGKVSAGLSFAFPGLEFDEKTNEDGKKPSDLGIIAQKEGDINAVVRDDFTVNLSRVFTQVGGNITIWSTEGNIDAGRGAKTALSVPETVVIPSNYGKKSVVRPAVSGSGVRAAAPQDSLTGQGDVFLFAPGGIVNAGEAGIGGSNVTISATAVLGANNIQVGGVSTGVPTASVGSLAAGLSGVSNLSASVSQIAQAATDTSEKDKSDKSDKSAKLGILSVDFIGYGDETTDTKNKNKSRPAS